jgi:hypothetical protein
MAFDLSTAKVVDQEQSQGGFDLSTAKPTNSQGTYSGDIQAGGQTALQGATLGFGDELAGLGGAIAGKAFNLVGLGDDKTFAEDYKTIRDRYRGDVDKFAKENPKSALGLSIAGSLPTIAAAPLRAASVGTGVLPMVMQAGKAGAAYGAVSGLGSSDADSIGGMAADTVKGGALGMALGAVSQPVISGIGAVGSNVAQRFSNVSSQDAARIKLAESLGRDVRGDVDPYLQAQSRMGKLGDEATVADSAGASTVGLLDMLATLPGKTKEAVSNMIHERQATRAGRMLGTADEALGTQGANASQLTKDLIAQRSKEAAPLYAQVENAPVTIDNDLMGLISATSPFHGEVQRLATMRGTPLKLTDIQPGDQIPLKHLDILKQTLYDVADSAKRAGSNTLARDAQSLRVRLTDKLDEASPKDQAGDSIYKKARDTFAGHSETLAAVDAGKTAMREGADDIRDLVSGMGKSEVDAFRVGVLQSLREKLGSQSGQTQMMKMWQEPNTSSRLKEIFGNDYRKFAADVAREARLKRIEGVGKGSQTAARQYAAGDLDALPVGEIGSAIANVKTGNIAGLVSSATNAWNRVQMPENTRNALGKLLLSKDPMEIQKANELIKRLSGKQMSRAGSIGAEIGYQANK